jgi:hypothetical protein
MNIGSLKNYTNPYHEDFRPCMMTVFMHDYAYPKPIKTGFLGLGVPIRRNPQDLQLYNQLTMEFVRDSTPEQLGLFIKEMLLKINKSKEIIES